MTNFQLVTEAIKAREKSYCPYSNFAVGAALLAENGNVFRGCNIENSSFSPTICAERTAFFKAVSEGEKKFVKIAIVGGKADENISKKCFPCGVCRQVMSEFCDCETFEILLFDGEKITSFTLKNLFPNGFSFEKN